MSIINKVLLNSVPYIIHIHIANQNLLYLSNSSSAGRGGPGGEKSCW